MKLLELYNTIADTANWVVSPEGFISQKTIGSNKVEPLLVKKLRLAMPTDEILKSREMRDVMVFHPLKEDVLKPETDVLDALRTSLNSRLNVTTCWVALSLLIIAGSSEDHAKLDPDQSEFLSHVKAANQDCVDDLKRIFDSMKLNAKDKTAVKIFTKKGGSMGGQKYTCLGVVKFPLYQELLDSVENTPKSGKPEVFGIKLSSKKSRDALIALFRYIFPKIDTPEVYQYGSSSLVAAFLDALLQTTAKIAAPINTVIDTFSTIFTDPDEMRIPGDWLPVFMDLGTMVNEIRMVPQQTANALEMPDDVKAKHAVDGTKAAPATQAPSSGAYVTPVADTGPAKTERGLDFAKLVKGGAQPQKPAFGFGQPQQQSQFGGNNTHPAFAALRGGQTQNANNPFAQFQTGNAQAGRSGFGFGGSGGNSGGGFGFGGSGRGF
jgi:uncharacterized membrane protein YgcG